MLPYNFNEFYESMGRSSIEAVRKCRAMFSAVSMMKNVILLLLFLIRRRDVFDVF